MADAFKAAGNKAFAEKNFEEAVEQFSKAIDADPTNHVLYSNRSGAYASLKDFTNALQDANKTTEIKPDWSKGWSRKGGALHGQGDLLGALDAFDEALKLDANNAQAKSGRDSVQRAIDSEAKGPGGDPFGNMFNDPNLIQKLANNPKTSGLLADPTFMNKLQNLRKNPSAMGAELGDPRMLQVMSVLLGIDMQMADPGQAAEKAAGGKVTSDDEEGEDIPMPDARPSSRPPPKREPTPEPEAEPEDEDAAAKRAAKASADEEKKLGTEQYKSRNFAAAIAHYDKAWSQHKDITYLTNKSAAQFEAGDYHSAIETCQLAISEGREMLADFKIIAKAFGRIGSSYDKLGDLPNAIDNYQRSLTEHRTPEILNKLRTAEKAKLLAEKTSYISPEEAEKARELGNAKFKDADWPAAVDAYSEMIKRAPEDPRGYSNRAACFIKLLTFPSAVSDCDEALKLDGTFIRAHLRKAQAYFAMREYSKCMDACAEASSHDTDGKNAREIQQQEQKALQAQFSAQEGESEEETMKRIQRDPEIMGILQDPVMQSILQQAKGDPKALQDHMKDPRVSANIRKLMAAGVIRMGR